MAVDNQDPVITDNPDPIEAVPVEATPLSPIVTPPATPAKEIGFSWKSKLGADLANAPTLQKFEDTQEGLSKAVESHLSLEKLLGHDKVPIPKDANDTEGWARFNKAMGVPDKPEGYGLTDVSLPENMKDLSFNKQQFAEVVHTYKLTPLQANGLWESYTKLNMDVYNKALTANQDKLNQLVNELRQEWGDGYDANVELGQMVINKFATDKEDNDWLTTNFTKDPRGVKFLARLGNQFAENKVGEFSYKRFSLTPEQAEAEWHSISSDPKHPYNNVKASQKERDAAIDYVNSLIVASRRNKG